MLKLICYQPFSFFGNWYVLLSRRNCCADSFFVFVYLMGGSKERITEQCNVITENIDIVSTREKLLLLQQSDAQLFTGWQSYDNLYNHRILENVFVVAKHFRDVIAANMIFAAQSNPNSNEFTPQHTVDNHDDYYYGHSKSPGQIIFSGAGTSGRIGFACARNYNYILKRRLNVNAEIFTYLIAGGDKALLRSQESAEDNYSKAIEDLRNTTNYFTTAKADYNTKRSGRDTTARIIPDQSSFDPEKSKNVFVGVSCGFTATYVAAQLKFLMKNDNFVTVLMGFNTPDMAKSIKISRVGSTFKEIASEFVKFDDKRHILLNPIYGPEAIAGQDNFDLLLILQCFFFLTFNKGSTRLKGGSMTKVLLDTAFNTALIMLETEKSNHIASVMRSTYGVESTRNSNSFFNSRYDLPQSGTNFVFDSFFKYEQTYRYTYKAIPQLVKVINQASTALLQSKHIYYVSYSNFGILGFIDASECPPTFGANYDDIRGFVVNGWMELGNRDKKKMRSYGDSYHISVRDFFLNFYNTLHADDLIIFIQASLSAANYNNKSNNITGVESSNVNVDNGNATSNDNISQKYSSLVNMENELRKLALKFHTGNRKRCKTALISISGNDFRESTSTLHVSRMKDSVDYAIEVILPDTSLFLVEFSTKLVLNAITTVAHINQGLTYGNQMINLRISNHKLYFRAIRLIQSIMHLEDKIIAEGCLLRAIYGTDDNKCAKEDNIENHVKTAVNKNYVIPLAIVLSSGQADSVAEAAEMMHKTPIIRQVIHELASKVKSNERNTKQLANIGFDNSEDLF